MTISSCYTNPYSPETEKLLLPLKRIFDKGCILHSVGVISLFKLNKEIYSSSYRANPYEECPYLYDEHDYTNILLCFQRAIRAVTIRSNGAQFLVIELMVTYEDENEITKSITTVIGHKFATYNLEY